MSHLREINNAALKLSAAAVDHGKTGCWESLTDGLEAYMELLSLAAEMERELAEAKAAQSTSRFYDHAIRGAH